MPLQSHSKPLQAATPKVELEPRTPGLRRRKLGLAAGVALLEPWVAAHGRSEQAFHSQKRSASRARSSTSRIVVETPRADQLRRGQTPQRTKYSDGVSSDRSEKSDPDFSPRLSSDAGGSGSDSLSKLGQSTRTGQRPATPPCDSRHRHGRTLASPSKLPQIPLTPHHRPSTDAFWDPDVVGGWNDLHTSPKKLFATTERPRSPIKPTIESQIPRAASLREQKREFDKRKHDLASHFLRELDENITAGKLGRITEPTGGISIRWTNKLNTTAGRANWKRETIRTKSSHDDHAGDPGEEHPQHRHHASIDVAEKIIDDEHRLLNVIAHEFCHLATFMVNGTTTNPHGKEFKVWASKCSQVFASRGVRVTTKHSYDIAYKYIWECIACGLEYKRHSKSIDVVKQRCGSCKGGLKQTRPTPRAPAKASGYQMFMKEQMQAMKRQYPDSPQKDIMKLVASEWSRRTAGDVSHVDIVTPTSRDSDKSDELIDGMKTLRFGETTAQGRDL